VKTSIGLSGAKMAFVDPVDTGLASMYPASFEGRYGGHFGHR